MSEEGVLPDPINVAKILQWKEPQNVTEVKQFLGCCSYNRKFIRGYSKVAKPLFDLTKNTSSLLWNDDCQKAFNSLKGSLSGPDVMSLPRDHGKFYVDVDACDHAIGGVISQIQEGKERVIAYAKRTLNKSECNYCVTDKELLAIRYFLEYFRHYLLGRDFVVRSDHKALKFLFSLKCPKGRVARWLEILSEYSFSVEYRKGSSHGNADSLSRCPNPKDCECSNVNMDENLKCGPCSKCRKRAVEMESKWPLRELDRMQNVYSQSEITNIVNSPSMNRKTTSKSGENRHNLFLRCYLFISFCLCTVTGLCKQLLHNSSGYLVSCQQFVQSQFSCTKYTYQKRSYERPGKCRRVPRLYHFLCSAWLKLGRWFHRCAKVTTRSHLDVENYVPWAECITPIKLKEMQFQDEDIRPLFDWLETSTNPDANSVGILSPSTWHYLCC